MKAITLTQPWATLVAIGAKRIETRSWATSYRGPLAIHAAKGLGPVGGKHGLWELVWHPPFRDVLAAHAESRHMDDILASLPRGAIVAVCELVGCESTDIASKRDGLMYARTGEQWPFSALERAFGDYAPGRYAWLLADVRPLPEPIPARGQLGLWEWDGEL